MTLYTLNGAYPTPLPHRIRLSDGRTRTDPSTFTEEEIADAGYIPAPPRLPPLPGYEVLWRDGEWEYTPLPAPAVEYRPLNKLETMTLFRMVTGMDDAGELTMRKDPALELHWMKWETDVPDNIFREHPVVEQFLNALEGLGYINAAQRQAMLDNWPTV